MTDHEKAIEGAKINFSAVWRISDELFTNAAQKIIQLPIERIEVRRCIAAGENFGKLTVYIYREDDENKEYYHPNNGSIQYSNLSPNIYEFKNELIKMTNK